jgi:hypothetical protein
MICDHATMACVHYFLLVASFFGESFFCILGVVFGGGGAATGDPSLW